MQQFSFANVAETSVDDLINPIPAKIYQDGGETYIEWIDMAGKDLPSLSLNQPSEFKNLSIKDE